jgi:hypothetical protein
MAARRECASFRSRPRARSSVRATRERDGIDRSLDARASREERAWTMD